MLNYRAARRLVYVPKGTDQIITYEPGDVVAGFSAWPEIVRRAHVEVGNVVMDIPTPTSAAAEAAEPRQKARRGRKPKDLDDTPPDDGDDIPPGDDEEPGLPNGESIFPNEEDLPEGPLV